MTALWTGEPVEHAGRFHRVSAHLLPRPVQRPRPAIWVAALWPSTGPIARARRFEGIAPIRPDGEPLEIDGLREVAAALGPGRDVIGGWLPGPSVADYAAAGVTWLVESRWPDGHWYNELFEVAGTDPRAAA